MASTVESGTSPACLPTTRFRLHPTKESTPPDPDPKPCLQEQREEDGCLKLHHLEYDDGSKWWSPLADFEWELLDGKSETEFRQQVDEAQLKHQMKLTKEKENKASKAGGNGKKRKQPTAATAGKKLTPLQQAIADSLADMDAAKKPKLAEPTPQPANKAKSSRSCGRKGHSNATGGPKEPAKKAAPKRKHNVNPASQDHTSSRIKNSDIDALYKVKPQSFAGSRDRPIILE